LNCFTPGQCFVITIQVMTVAQVSPHDNDAVKPPIQGVHHQPGMHHTGTHGPNDPHVGRILQPGNTGQITTGIGAPVAQETEDDRFKFV
jgi:hypothetical protein